MRLITNTTLVFMFALMLVLLFNTCKEKPTEPPPNGDKPTLTLKVEDVSCTEAWLSLTITNIQLPIDLTLYKNSVAQNTILCYGDTLLYIDSLLPKQNYTFKTQLITQNNKIITAEATTATMDTTSHNFTWQTFTFGQHSSSVLYDVAIINENNIWAVGAIYMNDSLGNPDSKRYNLVRWNGNKWTVERIPYVYQGTPFYHPIQSIFAFSENDIWFCGNGVIHYDGNNYIPISIPTNVWGPFQMNKLWGTSSNDLYVVGNGGNIAHYNGSSWRKIESPIGTGGTDVDLLDVWGTPDGSTVWACGYSNDYGKTALLRVINNKSEVLYDGSPNNQNNGEYIGPISGVWNTSNYFTYVTNWAFIYKQQNKKTLSIKRITPWYGDVAFAMRGSGHNSIFIAGQDGVLGHFNGMTYKEFGELKDNAKNYYGLSVKNNIAVAAGLNYAGLSSKAVISIGFR